MKYSHFNQYTIKRLDDEKIKTCEAHIFSTLRDVYEECPDIARYEIVTSGYGLKSYPEYLCHPCMINDKNKFDGFYEKEKK